MQLRSALKRALFAVLPGLALLSACKDESPVLSGDPHFPGGSRPVTLEAVIPAGDFLETLGVYTGFGDRRTFPFQVVANDFGGSLDANTLLRFSFPDSIVFSIGGQSRSRSYTLTDGRLVTTVDSLNSGRNGPVTLQLWELAQPFHSPSVSWTLAVDTGSVQTPWATPGGTRGALLSEAVYTPGATAGDTVTFQIDSVDLNRIKADSLFPGFVVTAGTDNRRLQLVNYILRTGAHPTRTGTERDTVVAQDFSPFTATFVYDPDPVTPENVWQAGGIRAARTVFALDLETLLPGCAPGTTCAPVRLEDVEIHRISLLLRPLPTPGGFDPLGPVPLTLFTVPDPGLGRRAPLGANVLDPNAQDVQVVAFAPGDTVVELPFTSYAAAAVRLDTLPTTFALLGERPVGTLQVRSFGVGFFEPNPRLRIVYTLPTRPELP
jgi:hypothetical protein